MPLSEDKIQSHLSAFVNCFTELREPAEVFLFQLIYQKIIQN